MMQEGGDHGLVLLEWHLLLWGIRHQQLCPEDFYLLLALW
jgi:hypothetical protein